MTVSLTGKRTWSLEIDQDGHYTYEIIHLVRSDLTDGPTAVSVCAGLPMPGSSWSFGSDVNDWAYCRPNMKINIHEEKEGERALYWKVQQTFSTRPLNRCGTTDVTDPLLEPMKISGSSVKYTEEATEDRFGNDVVNSAFEQIRGAQVEFDHNRDTVTIEWNVANLNYPLFAPMRDTVNDASLWGFPPRSIKLSGVTWEKKYHGECSVYYTRRFTFDISVKVYRYTGVVVGAFDRDIMDEAGKALKGHWDPAGTEWLLDNVGANPPDPGNPSHFVKIQDRNGQPMKAILDGKGMPITIKTRGAVESATNASPIVIASTAHGLEDGDTIFVEDVGGNTAANDTWLVQFGDVNHFILMGSTGNGAYTSGGIWKLTDPRGAGNIHLEKYDESNFLLLGIPASL